MLIEEFCIKVFLLPFLSHVAKKNGICNFFLPFPYITLPPGVTFPTPTTTTTTASTSFTFFPTIPTFVPTNFPTFPTFPTPTIITPPTPTIPTNCPTYPIICLPGGASPIAGCPCIDPRLTFRFAAAGFKGQSCASHTSQTAQCVNISQCSHFMDEYYLEIKSNKISFDQFLRRSKCNTDENIIMVCCPDRSDFARYSVESNMAVNTDISMSKDNPDSAIFKFSSLDAQVPETQIRSPILRNQINYFPKSHLNECGISKGPQYRIVGGFETRKGTYTWIVGLGQLNDTIKIFLCSGSLITVQHVITSGHCVSHQLNFARIGAHNLNDQDSIDVSIEDKVIHELYDPQTVKNDIAILKIYYVKSSIIKPICLPWSQKFNAKNLVGQNPFIAGWGAIKYRGPLSNNLHDVQVEIVDLLECKENYSKIFPGIDINENVICAGTGISDACQGDSGGPLMLPQLSDSQKEYHYYLIGLVSYGYECSKPGFPGIYTRISSYLSWIEKTIEITTNRNEFSNP